MYFILPTESFINTGHFLQYKVKHYYSLTKEILIEKSKTNKEKRGTRESGIEKEEVCTTERRLLK